jgi:type I restriction enzyme M protein
MIQVIQPTIGETIYDGACGSGGFLCEAFDYLKAKKGLSTKDAKTLQEKTFYGKEKKSLAYVIGIMNSGDRKSPSRMLIQMSAM